jgi:hypothetical protein
MDFDVSSVALLGRVNPEIPGRSPFSPIATGICIDPDGVVASCCHSVDHFFERWSPYLFSTRTSSNLVLDDVQRHERPWASFMTSTGREDPCLGIEYEARGYPVLSVYGDRNRDVAVLELGGRGKVRPIPYVPFATKGAYVGQHIQLIGHFQDAKGPTDADGQAIGFKMTRVETSVLARTARGFLIDTPVRPGMSGAGVCDMGGALLGNVIEVWSPALAKQTVGIDRAVGLVAYAEWLLPIVNILRTQAKARERDGGLPWCGLSKHSG